MYFHDIITEQIKTCKPDFVPMQAAVIGTWKGCSLETFSFYAIYFVTWDLILAATFVEADSLFPFFYKDVIIWNVYLCVMHGVVYQTIF